MSQVATIDKRLSAVEREIKRLTAKFFVSGSDIKDGTIGGVDIVDGAVTTAKIADNAVVSSKLAMGSVVSESLADDAVVTNKLADGVVTGNKLSSQSVSSSKIADYAVTDAKIADRTITSEKIALGAIDASIMSNSAGIVGSMLANSAIQTINLNDNCITEAKISPLAVTWDKISPSYGHFFTLTAQSISTSTETAVNFAGYIGSDSMTLDANGIDITLLKAGTYVLIAYVTWGAGTVGERLCWLADNTGLRFTPYRKCAGQAVPGFSLIGVFMATFALGHKVRLYVYQDSGTAIDVAPNIDTRLNIYIIRVG